MSTQTLIIGAGPVGLVLGALLKQRFKWMEVTLINKRQTYTREQIVIFRPTVLELLPREFQEFLETRGCFVYPPNVNRGNCYTQKTPGGLISLPLHLFEEDVWDYCNQLGVKRIIRDMEKLPPAQIKTLRETGTLDGTNYDYIFGCDGTQSWTALNILQSKLTPPDKQHALYYGMGLILDPLDRQSRIKTDPSSGTQTPPQNLYRGFSAKGDSKFYIGLAISKKIYTKIFKIGEDLKKKKEKRKLVFNDMPPSIQTIIKSAIKYYDFNINLPKQTKIFVFALPLQYFNPPSKILKNKSTCTALVGDSVFRPHFFSWAGVNSGIVEADKIVELIDSDLTCKKIVGAYNRFCKRERRSRWSGYSGLAIPFKAIKDSLKNISKPDLVQIGRDKGFGPIISEMDKDSVGYLMGCDAVPGCTIPKESPGVESFLTCFKDDCPEYKVRNPRTRRCIKVGGQVYEKVCS